MVLSTYATGKCDVLQKHHRAHEVKAASMLSFGQERSLVIFATEDATALQKTEHKNGFVNVYYK